MKPNILKLSHIVLRFFVILVPLLPSITFSQQAFNQLANPIVGKNKPMLFSGIEILPSSKVINQNAKFANFSNKTALSFPIFQNSKNELGFNFSSLINAVETDGIMILPTTKEIFPDNLTDIRFGPFYKYLFDNEWVFSVSAQAGSASDNPFDEFNDLEFIGNSSLIIPTKNKGYWVVFLNYANNREFLPHIPLPGFGYIFPRNKYIRGLVGIPALFFELFPENKFRISVSYVPIVHIKSDLKYKFYPFFGIFAGFNWKGEHFYRNNRIEKSKQLFWLEKDVHAGIELNLSRKFSFKISGGFKFDRNFFESKSIVKDTSFNRIDLKNSGFCLAEIQVLAGN